MSAIFSDMERTPETSSTDQPPGTYRYRARRGAPWQPVKLIYDGVLWHCLLIGHPVFASGTYDVLDIPFVRTRGPFHPISEAEYVAMLAEYERAVPGSPLKSPDDRVDLRSAPPL
jgi:hypothetical protein